CTSFPIIGPSFRFLAHSSSREFELKRQTTKNNNKYSRERQSAGSNLFRPKPATVTLTTHRDPHLPQFKTFPLLSLKAPSNTNSFQVTSYFLPI
ncbi:hypothetical protein P3392_24315, partial [Vibrio parahaemolyticus]|nr:hypothetical protein [Vibrio parahaemolyticus]